MKSDLSFSDGLSGHYQSSVGQILESDISAKRVVGYEYPTYSFQTAYQIIVRTVHKKPSFPRRRE